MKASDFTFCNRNADLLPHFGFKIHLSATIETYQQLFDLCEPYLMSKKISFKYLKTKEAVNYNFSVQESSAESGKFITIYPRDKEHFKELIEELYQLIPKHQEGIYILSDRAYKDSSCIFYRYGCIKMEEHFLEDNLPTLFGPQGQKWQDYQKNYFDLPDWIEDIQEPIVGEPSYLLEHYQLQGILKSNNGGNIYLAKSKKNQQPVVIKESRPFILYHPSLRKEALRKAEWSLLKKVSGPLLKRVERVKEWINTYYIYEYEKGHSLGDFLEAHSLFVYKRSQLSDNYQHFRQLMKSFHGVLKTVAALHEKGLVLNDIHPDNFQIDEDFNVVFVDLEHSYLSNKRRPQIGIVSETALASWNALDGKQADCKKVARMFLYLLGRLQDKFVTTDYRALQTLLRQKGIDSNFHLLISYLNEEEARMDTALALFEQQITYFSYKPSLSFDFKSLQVFPQVSNPLEGVEPFCDEGGDVQTALQLFEQEGKLGLTGLSGVLLFQHSKGVDARWCYQMIETICLKMVDAGGGKGVQISENCISPYLSDGTAGIIYMLLRVDSTKYLPLAEQIAPILLTEFAQSIGLSHGMLGIAAILLSLYRLTQKTIYIETAYELLMSSLILSDHHPSHQKEALYLLGNYQTELSTYQKGRQV